MYSLLWFMLWMSFCIEEVVSLPIKITVKLQEQDTEMDTSAANCPECVKKKDIEQMRIEQIKMTMLDKLHMTHIPLVQKPATLPEPLLAKFGGLYSQEGDIEDTKEQYYAKTKEVITFVSSVHHCDQSNLSVCFGVHIKHQYSREEITSVNLFLKNTNPGQTLSLHYISNQQSGPILVGTVSNTVDSWVPIDILSTISSELGESPTSTLVFKLSCGQCEDLLSFLEKDLPFVEFHFEEAVERSRRSVEQCNPDSRLCCKESFYVSFKDIGWDTWIMEPSGYWANYCRGSCEGPTDLLAYRHTHVKNQLPENEETSAVKASTCCSPTRLAELRVLYLNEDGNVIGTDIPNMSVEACGCA